MLTLASFHFQIMTYKDAIPQLYKKEIPEGFTPTFIEEKDGGTVLVLTPVTPLDKQPPKTTEKVKTIIKTIKDAADTVDKIIEINKKIRQEYGKDRTEQDPDKVIEDYLPITPNNIECAGNGNGGDLLQPEYNLDDMVPEVITDIKNPIKILADLDVIDKTTGELKPDKDGNPFDPTKIPTPVYKAWQHQNLCWDFIQDYVNDMNEFPWAEAYHAGKNDKPEQTMVDKMWGWFNVIANRETLLQKYKGRTFTLPPDPAESEGDMQFTIKEHLQLIQAFHYCQFQVNRDWDEAVKWITKIAWQYIKTKYLQPIEVGAKPIGTIIKRCIQPSHWNSCFDECYDWTGRYLNAPGEPCETKPEIQWRWKQGPIADTKQHDPKVIKQVETWLKEIIKKEFIAGTVSKWYCPRLTKQPDGTYKRTFHAMTDHTTCLKPVAIQNKVYIQDTDTAKVFYKTNEFIKYITKNDGDDVYEKPEPVIRVTKRFLTTVVENSPWKDDICPPPTPVDKETIKKWMTDNYWDTQGITEVINILPEITINTVIPNIVHQHSLYYGDKAMFHHFYYAFFPQERDPLKQVTRTKLPIYAMSGRERAQFETDATTGHTYFKPTRTEMYLITPNTFRTFYYRGKPKCTYVHNGYQSIGGIQLSQGYFNITAEWRSTDTDAKRHDFGYLGTTHAKLQVAMQNIGPHYDQWREEWIDATKL